MIDRYLHETLRDQAAWGSYGIDENYGIHHYLLSDSLIDFSALTCRAVEWRVHANTGIKARALIDVWDVPAPALACPTSPPN